MNIRYFLISIILIYGFPVKGQETDLKNIKTDKLYNLQWKIEEGKPIGYRTIMDEIDTAKIGMVNHGLFDKFIKIDTSKLSTSWDSLSNFFKLVTEGTENYSAVTLLSKREDKTIDVRIIYDDFSEKSEEPESDPKDENLFFKSMMKGVQLRGLINKDGGIESFYMKRNQKNLLAGFFELPEKEVRLKESWSLEINWITMDHNFMEENSERINKVTLEQVKEIEGEMIAFLSYNIYEKVEGIFKSPMSSKGIPTMFMIELKSIAEFSITKGRWNSYSGVLSSKITGYQNVNSKEMFALEQIEVLPQKIKKYLKE